MKNTKVKVDYLCDNLQYAPQAAGWIFDEWVKPRASGRTKNYVLEKIKTCGKNRLPVMLIASVNDKCVGTVSLVANDLDSSRFTPWLASLYIDKDYRNQGIGKQLTEKLKSVVKELGFSEMFLRTEEAGDYYRKQGWQYIETCEDNGLRLEIFKIKLI